MIHLNRYKLAGHDHDDNDDDNLLSWDAPGRDSVTNVDNVDG